MEIKVYVGELRAQLDEIKQDSCDTIQSMEAIQKALMDIIIEPSLTGITYDSAKNYFEMVYIPVTKGFILVSETMIKTNQTLIDRYLNEVDVNDLQEYVLEARIDQYNRLTQMLDSLEDQTGLIDNMIDNLQEMKFHTTKKLDQLREFDYFSIQIFDELEAQLAELEIGVQIIVEGKTWNQSTGTFSTLGLNLEWATSINQKWAISEGKKKGLDEETNQKLSNYDIIKCYDPMTGKTTWALEKDGLSVIDPELTAYLRKVGEYLNQEQYSIIALSPKEWEQRVNNVWKINGTEYFSGKQYGWWMSILAHGQDARGKLDESGVWDSLWSLGFMYGAVKSINRMNQKLNEPKVVKKAAKYGNSDRINQNLTREDIVTQLDGVTKKSTEIAQELRNKQIKINILGDELFESYTGQPDAMAIQVKDQIYVKKSSSTIMNDIVHEGIHVIDYLDGYGVEGVSNWSWEKRAYFYERQFQIQNGEVPNFENLNDLQVHIWRNYENSIYDPYSGW